MLLPLAEEPILVITEFRIYDKSVRHPFVTLVKSAVIVANRRLDPDAGNADQLQLTDEPPLILWNIRGGQVHLGCKIDRQILRHQAVSRISDRRGQFSRPNPLPVCWPLEREHGSPEPPALDRLGKAR